MRGGTLSLNWAAQEAGPKPVRPIKTIHTPSEASVPSTAPECRDSRGAMDASLMLDRTHGGSEQPIWIKGTADKGIFGLIKARDRERLPVWSPFDAPSVDVLSRSRRRSNKQVLLAPRLMSTAARAHLFDAAAAERKR